MQGATNPLLRIDAVTPSDSADLGYVARQVYAAGAGTITAHDVNGNSFTFTIAAGERVDVFCIRILATGTTATGIEAGQ